MTTLESVQPIAAGRNADLLRIELLIAQLLRVGVLLSFVILAIGIGAVVITGQTGYQQIGLDNVNTIVQYHPGKPDFPSSLGEVFDGVLALRPYAIIALGLVALIAIPVMQVAVAAIAFAIKRDRLYVFITAFVLAMLFLSFVLAEASG